MKFDFRPITTADMTKLHEWIFRPHVRVWWNDPYDKGLADIIAEMTSDLDYVQRYIGLLKGREIGYFQVWWDLTPPKEVGIDQFLANESDLNQGIGSAAVHAFSNYIFSSMTNIDIISLDPSPNNNRAIRAYEKAGFVHQPDRSTPQVYLMTRGRP